MRKLSTGEDSTLETYRNWAVSLFGEDSGPVKFLDEKIATQGRDQEVLADERQMLILLSSLKK